MDYAKESLRLHGDWKGKIEVVKECRLRIKTTFLLHIHQV